MDLVFCGTPQFAVPTLRRLLDEPSGEFRVRLVVCQPDRPSGRGMETAAPAIKRLALERCLPLAQPHKIKDNPEFRGQLEAMRPDAIIVVAYGRLIPDWMLALPPLGNINLHASLLPKYRGAAPVQWAIAMGESVTGATTMRLDSGLDTGDILLQQELPIAPEDTAETLMLRLSEMGAPLVLETLRGLKAGTITPRPQNHSQATLAPILKKEDGRIDFQRTATEIWNRVRGFLPWPGAFTSFGGKGLQVWRAKPLPLAPGVLAPGEMQVEADHLYVGCALNTTLELLEVQLEGKKRMSARDFINGYRPKSGERLASGDRVIR